MLSRAHGVANLGNAPEPFRSIFGRAYDRYRKGADGAGIYTRGAELRRVGRRSIHEHVCREAANDTLVTLLKAARYHDPHLQLLALAAARKCPRR